MAGVTITGLPPVTSAAYTDVLPVVQNGVTSEESLSQISILFGFDAVSRIISPVHGGTGVDNGDNQLTLSGDLTTTGAFNPTLNFTGGNTYTFPSAGQTLAGLAGFTMGAAINMGSHQINAVADPTLAQDAATKNYVDSTATGRVFKSPVQASSTTALTVTYANGASGVGATLTNATTQAAFATDGYSAALNDRILIKDQASTFQNGLYTVTTVGSGASNWVLTRATDMDQAAEFKLGTVVVLNGSTLGGSTWTESATVTTVGTDPVTFNQTGAESGVISVGTAGLATGGPINSTGTVTVTGANSAQMIAATSATVAVTPSVMFNHPGVTKAWAYVHVSGGAANILKSYNVTSVTYNAAGDTTLNLSITLDDNDGAVVYGMNAIGFAIVQDFFTTTLRTRTTNTSSVNTDLDYYVAIFD